MYLCRAKRDGCWRKKDHPGSIKGELRKREAAEALEVSIRSVYGYVSRFQQRGPEGLDSIKRGYALDRKR
jgi:hypothetical protein